MSERIVVYLNEQKAGILSSAAVLAEYVLTHKFAFSPVSAVSRPSPPRSSNPRGSQDARECYYCHQDGHVIAKCLTLKRREQPSC